ncbi:hypothetical protein PT974_09897 [Cladobotryum mycophilum]|uniref:Uncharacterized protein n=1 Tax=Cladobotryum mycophilum TaxID=491253 RepID=A0ABR0SHF8_9HYPO
MALVNATIGEIGVTGFQWELLFLNALDMQSIQIPGYISFAAIVAIYSSGAGGNFIVDATSFLEFLPTSYMWLVTFMAVFWPVGYTINGLLA